MKNRLMNGGVKSDIGKYGEGLLDGAISIFKGAFRFGEQSTRHFSGNSMLQAETAAETQALSAAMSLYVNNEGVRSQVNSAIMNHVVSSSYNIGFATGRFITGVMSFGGPVAITGDTMHMTNMGRP